MVSIKTKKAKITVKEMKRDPMWELYDKVYMKVEPYKQKIIYGIVGVAAAIALGALVYTFMNFRAAEGREAFARALEIYNADVVKDASDRNPNSIKKTYADEQQKYKEAAAAFDGVASSYSSQRELARYYAAVSRSHIDPAKAQTELEELAKGSSEVAYLSKVALAELYASKDQHDKALAGYQLLKDTPGPFSKSLMYYNLGRMYERQGNNPEAAKAYFEAASADRDSSEGKKSEERLKAIDSAMADKLPAEKKEDVKN